MSKVEIVTLILPMDIYVNNKHFILLTNFIDECITNIPSIIKLLSHQHI